MRRLATKLIFSALAGILPAGAFAQVPLDPYRAASSYNVTVVARSAPNPALNMPNFTRCCDIPNLNPARYEWIDSGSCFGGCGNSCGNSCGALFARPSWRGCSTSSCGNSCGNSCGSCGNSCGAIFARTSWRGCSTSSCGNSCGNSCGSCGSSCGALFARPSWRGCSTSSCGNSCGNTCGSCGNSCGAIFARPSWRGCGCDSGCSTGCTSGCAPAVNPTPVPPTPPQQMPAVKPMAGIETEGGVLQIGFFRKSTPPDERCDSCPPNGPKPKHHVKGAAGLGCASCGTWESEATFIFGSCRQFFGEPTHKWMHSNR